MIKNFKLTLLLCSLISVTQLFSQNTGKPVNGNWTKGSPDRFMGVVWVEYFINDTISDFLSSRVLFESNSRSNWHRHSGKQIVFAIDGEGFYKEKSKPIRILKKGDLVVIEPGTIHSHGSKNNYFMQGVMMNDVGKKESTIWMHPTSEAELSQN